MYKQRDIEKLWSKYEGLLHKLQDEKINDLLENQGQRIIMGTYSQREKEQFCGIGGFRVGFRIFVRAHAQFTDAHAHSLAVEQRRARRRRRRNQGWRGERVGHSGLLRSDSFSLECTTIVMTN